MGLILKGQFHLPVPMGQGFKFPVPLHDLFYVRLPSDTSINHVPIVLPLLAKFTKRGFYVVKS